MKQKFEIGNYFAIQLKDKTFSVGKIIAIEPDALNSIVIALFDTKIETKSNIKTTINSFSKKNIISIIFTTKDLLNKSNWKIIDIKKELNIGNLFNLKELRKKDFMDVKIIGSGIIEKFLNAYFKLGAWNEMKDPKYYDKLLILSNKKPDKVILKKRFLNKLIIKKI